MKDRIIVALDVSDISKARELVNSLYLKVKFFKIGLEMINTGQGPELITYINKLGGKVFYDIKLNDIPNTVAKASKVISGLGVDMFTVHASAGREAIREAVKNRGKSKIIGVTVLTSLEDDECLSVFGAKPDVKVIQFADMLMELGADGMVCSVSEAKLLRKFKRFKSLKIITPGIRPVWADKNDQRRSTTPKEAIMAGADYLVIGRPITSPPKKIGSSLRAVDAIIKEIS